MTRLARALALAGAMVLQICGASAQQFPSGSIQGNAGATAAPPRAITPSAWHDRWCSLTQFAFPVRGASSWSCAVMAAGVQAFLVTPSSANLLAALTDETGTGAAVFATSPVLVTPNLGTPSAATLTNATGLPIATGVSGLGTGIATFLATPSSANLATAVTGDSGTGALLFSISPSLQTPILGVATATSINKMAITAPATASTLAVANNKTATINNTLTFSGTDASSVAFGAGGTVAYESRSIATGCGLAGGGDLSADRTLRLSLTVNAQTGTTYTVLDGDCGKLVSLSNASAVAVTLPQPGGSFISGWNIAFQNKGAGTVTITPTSSTVNGSSTLVLTQNQGAHCDSDGTNYTCVLGVGAGGGAGTVTQVVCGAGLSGGTITATGTCALYFDPGSISNCTIAASVASNHLTVALKGKDGNDPSASNPCAVSFRNATATTGTYAAISVTAATSFTANSGSTFGASNGIPFRLWVTVINNAGTVVLGVSNQSTATRIFPINEGAVASSTTCSACTNATAAGTYYSTAGQTSKAVRILGYMDWGSGLATAGAFASVPTTIQMFGPGVSKPGDQVQEGYVSSGALNVGTNSIPVDDTIPQSGEGDEFFTQAITPTATMNHLRIRGILMGSCLQATTSAVMAVFQDSTANALSAGWAASGGGSGSAMNMQIFYNMLAGTVSSTTFKIRAGCASGGYTLNGSSGARFFGGSFFSEFSVKEIMG